MTQQDLPAGWATTILRNLLTVIRGVSYKKHDACDQAGQGLVPILRANNIDQTLNFEGLVYVPGHYVKAEQLLSPNPPMEWGFKVC